MLDRELWLCYYGYVILAEGAMHRTTIMLPEELKSKAKQRAQSYGVSLGELIRLALERYLKPVLPGENKDPYLSCTLVFDEPGGPTDISERHDDYLDEIYQEKLDRGKS